MAELTHLAKNKQNITKLHCSAEFTAEVHDEIIVLSVLNIFLSITAFLGNTLILAALRKEKSLHSPSKLLYRNLAVTDLCVGIIAEPLFITYLISLKTGRWDICYHVFAVAGFAGYILCGVSLLASTAISLDRLLALLLGLRYRPAVTLKKVYISVFFMWVLSIAGSSSFFWSPDIFIPFLYTLLSFCLPTIIFSYLKIFFTLHHHQIQAHQGQVPQIQPVQAIPLNIARYRKAVYSALWVQVTLVVCYLPFVVQALIHYESSEFSLSGYLGNTFTYTLVFLNSSLNPFIYCWKIKEVRQAVKETIRHLICCLSN